MSGRRWQPPGSKSPYTVGSAGLASSGLLGVLQTVITVVVTIFTIIAFSFAIRNFVKIDQANSSITTINEEIITINGEIVIINNTFSEEIAELQDPENWQIRVSGNCTEEGTSIQSIDEFGGVVCVSIANATVEIDASQVVSGEFDDARISESSVIQYESSIDHLVIQNVGTNTHAQIDTFIADIDTTIDDRIAITPVGDLANVDTTTNPPNLDDSLRWDGVNWVPGSTAVTNLTDIVDEQIALTNIGDLADVDTTTVAPEIGDVLVWDGTNWVPSDNVQTLNDTIQTQQEEIEVLQGNVTTLQTEVDSVTGWTITEISMGTATVSSSGVFFSAPVNPEWRLYRATLGVMTIQYIELDTWTTTANNAWSTEQVRFDFTGLTTTISGGSVFNPLAFQFISSTFDWLGLPDCLIGVSGWTTDSGGASGALRWFIQQPTGGTCNPLGPISQVQPFRLTLPGVSVVYS